MGAAKIAARESRIGDRLPYATHVDEATIRTRDGMLIQVLKLEGFPFETRDDEELDYRKQIRETLLRGAAGSRLALYHHVVRRPVVAEFSGQPEEPFARALDERWRAALGGRQLFANELFLTLVRRPLQGRAGIAESLFRRAKPRDADLDADLRALHALRESFAATLTPYGARTLTTYEGAHGLCSEPASFLALLLGGEPRPVLLPEGDLGQTIADRRLDFGLDAMALGPSGVRPEEYGAIVSLKDYPARSTPGMLDGVLRLPIEMVLTESFSFVDRQVTLDRMGLALRRLKAAEDDAFSLREELGQARDQVGAGRAAYGDHHLSILVRAIDPQTLDASVAEVQAQLTETGAVAVREDVNLEPAFWAQFPGNLHMAARKALISTTNFASLASFHNHAGGQAADNHWGPAVTVLETTAFGPYNFNFHVADLGNFTVIGPSGSGKTVLMTFLLAQAQKFKPRLVYFDKDRGADIFVRAIGGRYDVLRPGEATGLNPLQLPENGANRAFLIEWLSQLLSSDGMPLDAEERALIADAVDANFAADPEHRRLRYLREMFVGARRPAAGDLANRLAAWAGEGEHAWLFDNETDQVDLDRDVYGFDMTRLLDAPVIRTPAMMYLFHRIEQQLDGTPTIIVVDEGWKALDDEVFVRRIKDWEKTIRKRNGIVGFATQSASDALESRIASAIIEQAATQIFFPNPRARAADYIDGFNLSAHEYELVRSLPDTSRSFLIKQADHSVVARLDLGGMRDLLSVLAGTERSVRKADAARESAGEDPADWLPVFLGEEARR
ncbi:MAG: VirB4 family type IV secretion/conjugal transfer ATPase [Sphingomonadaceae bacterium]|nr:VirB4 family type IV secretion/conjugal transfer ATPase [Sphingomonadaceae bacterium]